MAQATQHLSSRSSAANNDRRRRQPSAPRGSNPNDWIPPESDARIDLVGPVWRAAAAVLAAAATVAAAYPAPAAALTAAALLAAARISHLRGRHTDIPFRQYLRFQVLPVKSIVGFAPPEIARRPSHAPAASRTAGRNPLPAAAPAPPAPGTGSNPSPAPPGPP
jgi:hypothetical protein